MMAATMSLAAADSGLWKIDQPEVRWMWNKADWPYRSTPVMMRFANFLVITDSCWLWTGQHGRRGYAVISFKKRPRRASRLAYTFFRGEIPDGYQIDHLCRNTGCVNPAHLEAVTGAENNRRSASPTALNARKTHCPRGHAYMPDNMLYDTKGGRLCKICVRIQKRDYMRRVRPARKGA